MLVPLMNATFMRRITRPRRGRATRKLLGPLSFALAALGGLAGCHTPGPGHVYAWCPAAPATVQDLDAQQNVPPVAISGRVNAGENVVGLAYDFNTDFLCLRLEPGAHVRIFKRGENRFVREWALPAELAAPERPATLATGLALAVRPQDRRLFALHPAKPEIWEFTLDGQFVRAIALAPLPPAALGGLAFDHVYNRLVALLATTPARLVEIAPDGSWTPLATLSSDEVAPTSLGCNGDAGEYYVPLATGGVGVFDRRGALVRRLALAGNAAALAAGPRAFLRVF